MNLKLVHESIPILAHIRKSDVELSGDLESFTSKLATVENKIRNKEFSDLLKEHDTPVLKYLYGSIFLLKKLAELLAEGLPDSTAVLISIQQQQNIKILLQLIFSLGMSPCLAKGVNVPLLMKTAHLKLLHNEEWSPMQKHALCTSITRDMIILAKCAQLRPLILTHLGDLLSALFQFMYCKIKEPQKDDGGTSEVSTKFVMTKEWYERLMKEREEFITLHSELVGSLYKPLIIKELLILLMPNRPKDLPIPRWLDKAIASSLNTYLTGPGGVALVIRACFPSESDSVDWKKIDSLAKLITGISSDNNIDLWYSSISTQIISLFSTTGTYCLPVAKACIVKLLARDEPRGKFYILDKLFEPLILCSQPINSSFFGTLVSEEALDRCLGNISKLFTTESTESTISTLYLLKISKVLFKLYLEISGTPCRLSSTVEDLLIRFLYYLDTSQAICNTHLAFIFDEPDPDILELHESLHFELGPTGGAHVVVNAENAEILTAEGVQFVAKYERSCELFKELLGANDLYKKKVLCDLFNVLLTRLFSNWKPIKTNILDIKPDLLSAEELIFLILGKKEKKLMTIKLLADLSENESIKSCIAEDPEPILKFLEMILENMVSTLEIEVNEDGDDLSEVIIPLSIIDVASHQLKIGSARWKLLNPLLPSLLKIKEKHPMEKVSSLSNKLYERIVTRGATNRDQLGNLNSIDVNQPFGNIMAMKNSKSKNKPEEKKVLIEELKSGCSKPAKKEVVREDVTNECLESSFEKVIELMCSEEVPLKGHGLLQLEKLIRKKIPQVLERKEQLLELLKNQLKDTDSYVYLSAVSALEALCNVDAESTVACLCQEYVGSKSHCSDYQLKVGEVLVRITRCVSNIKTTSRDSMVDTFLFGSRSSDEYLRASSLSNLGEVLKNLGFSYGSILQEVFICVKSIATTDKSDMVRRAAVILAQFLIVGYSGSAFLSLESVLRDLYRTLLHIEATDKDEVVRIHAQLALAEINSEVKAQFLEPRRLEKKISILGFSP